MSDQSAMIELVKVACLKATTTLCVELFHRFFDAKIMSALGIVYSLYWLCEKNATKDFLPQKSRLHFVLARKSKVVL